MQCGVSAILCARWFMGVIPGMECIWCWSAIVIEWQWFCGSILRALFIGYSIVCWPFKEFSKIKVHTYCICSFQIKILTFWGMNSVKLNILLKGKIKEKLMQEDSKTCCSRVPFQAGWWLFKSVVEFCVHCCHCCCDRQATLGNFVFMFLRNNNFWFFNLWMVQHSKWHIIIL